MTELTTPQHIKVNSSSHSHNEEEDELRQHSQNMPQSEKPKQKCSLDFIWKDINIKLNKKKVEDQKALLIANYSTKSRNVKLEFEGEAESVLVIDRDYIFTEINTVLSENKVLSMTPFSTYLIRIK